MKGENNMSRIITAFLIHTLICAALSFVLIYTGALFMGTIFTFDLMLMVMLPLTIGLIGAYNASIHMNHFI